MILLPRVDRHYQFILTLSSFFRTTPQEQDEVRNIYWQFVALGNNKHKYNKRMQKLKSYMDTVKQSRGNLNNDIKFLRYGFIATCPTR